MRRRTGRGRTGSRRAPGRGVGDAFEDDVDRGRVVQAVADAAGVEQGAALEVDLVVRVVGVAVPDDGRDRAVAGGRGVLEHAEVLRLVVVEPDPLVHARRRMRGTAGSAGR